MNENCERKLKINISDTERIVLKQNDNIISVYIEEDLSGITRKLVFYDLIKKKWDGYNSHSFNLWFKLCKKYKFISPKIIRFITISDLPEEIKYIKKTFTCFKRKINITTYKITQRIINYD